MSWNNWSKTIYSMWKDWIEINIVKELWTWCRVNIPEITEDIKNRIIPLYNWMSITKGEKIK